MKLMRKYWYRMMVTQNPSEHILSFTALSGAHRETLLLVRNACSTCNV